MQTILYKGIKCETLSLPNLPDVILQGQKPNGDGFQEKISKQKLEEYKQGIIEKDKAEKIWELKYSRSRAILKTGSWILCKTEMDKLKGLPQFQNGTLTITLKTK